jgi:hypothetical protein
MFPCGALTSTNAKRKMGRLIKQRPEKAREWRAPSLSPLSFTYEAYLWGTLYQVHSIQYLTLMALCCRPSCEEETDLPSQLKMTDRNQNPGPLSRPLSTNEAVLITQSIWPVHVTHTLLGIISNQPRHSGLCLLTIYSLINKTERNL